MSMLHRRRFLQVGAALAATAVADPALAAPALEDTREPRFRLGLVTYNIAKDWDVPTLLKVCKTTGLAAVELRTTHKHGVEPSLGSEERKTVRKRFADAKVELWGLGSACEYHSPDPAVVKKNIELTREFVKLAADLGARGVKVAQRPSQKGVPVEKTLEQIGKALIPCGEAAAQAGVEIWVEVHGAPAKPEYMKTIMEHCGQPRVGITWNSNASDLVNGSVAESFRLLQPWLRSCHINDLYKDLQGSYPYRELFRLMRQMGYDRVTLIEVGRTLPDVGTAEEFLRYYRALWHELARG